MSIYGMKAKKVFACPGCWSYIAEAVVDDGDGGEVYVTVQDYDMLELTVSSQSVYAFLVEDEGEPAEEFLEEYTSWKAAKESKYAEVFDRLKKAIKMLEVD